MRMQNKKLAIVLLNMGGPGSLEQVKPFLYNLFSDPAIIKLPFLLRIPLSRLITLSRLKKSKAIYASIGGRSPILEETKLQQQQLFKKLKNIVNDIEIFVAMRYTEPRAISVIKEIQKINPEQILLLPLYPQFSESTTGSSFNEFFLLVKKIIPNIVVRKRCCYPIQQDFINAHVDIIKENLKKLINKNNFCILFSAHSLPIKNILAGDPYQWQVEQTVDMIVKKLGIGDANYKITYQSKVGPLEWLSPSTDSEIVNLAKDKKSLIIVPISFVSEHSETLVELDIEYKKLAENLAVEYIRIPTLSVHDLFINSLMQITLDSLNCYHGNECVNKRICPQKFTLCPNELIKN